MRLLFIVIFWFGSLLLSQLSWAGDYTLKITKNGFEPETIQVSKGEDVTLKVIRTTTETCAKKIAVPSKRIKMDLPLNQEVVIALGKIPQGRLKFACGMGMLHGQIVAK